MADEKQAALWTLHRTDDGQEYYYNADTGETTWERPEGVDIAEPEEEAEQQQQAAGTWTSHTTDDGQEYFYNADTGETTWERPEGVTIHEPEADASPQRQESPSAVVAAAEPAPMEVDNEEPTVVVDKEPQKQVEEEKKIVEVDPAEKAEAALKKPDAILEPDCYNNIQAIMDKVGAEEGLKMATDTISDSYYGHTVICGLLASWLRDLKASSSTASADGVQKKDTVESVSNEVRDIAQGVLYDATKEKFNKAKGDEMTNMSSAEIWFIGEMISSPRWRKLLIDLATTNKDSVLLKYCIRRISDLGHHRELAKRINMTDDFSVYNSTLKAEFSAIGDLFSSMSGDSDSPMDLREIVEDIKRMCTSASFTYLYAIELLRTLVAKAKQEAASNEKLNLQSAIRKWERLIEELEVEMTASQSGGSSTVFRKRRLDSALTMSELHQHQRRRHKPSPDGDGNENVERDESRDALESALELLLSRYSRGLPLDDRTLDKLLPTEDSDESSNTTGKLMVAHPLSIQALLDQLFKPGSSRARSMSTRNKCARLVALAAQAADSTVGNEPTPPSESQEESPTEILTGMLLTATQLCELLENMMTFEVISDPTLASDDSSAGRKLCALALRSAPIAQGVIMWASEIAKGPGFVTSASYPTFAPSILSLARVISAKHPFTRSSVLDIALVFLKHSNRELSYQKMNALRLQALRLLIFLLVKGEVCAVLGSVTRRLRQQGASEIDASLVRYFVGGLLDVMRPPFSLPLFRELGPMLTAPKCIEALRSSYFGESNKTRLSLLVKSFSDTLAKTSTSCTKDDKIMISTLNNIYCS